MTAVPLPSLTPHGTIVGTDLLPIQGATATDLESTTAADLAAFTNDNLQITFGPSVGGESTANLTIGAPIVIAKASAAAGGLTVTATTTAAVLPGEMILIFAATNGLVDMSGFVDTAVNDYFSAQAPSLTTSGTRQKIYYSFYSNGLPLGSTITGTWNSTSGDKGFVAVVLANSSIFDQNINGVTGASVAPALAISGLDIPNEAVIVFTMALAGATDAFTESAGFATLTSQAVGAAKFWLSFVMPNSINARQYTATLAPSDTWGVKMVAVEGAVPSDAYNVVLGTVMKNGVAVPKVAIKYGYFNSVSATLGVTSGTLCGVTRGRTGVNNTIPGAGLTNVNIYRNAGFTVTLSFRNSPGGLVPDPVPTDLAAYAAQISASLALLTPEFCVIENEENDGVFFQTQCADADNPYLNPGTANPATFPATAIATATAYASMLSAATTAAHALGYKIANGGTTYRGIFLAYWHYLFNQGRLDLADEFARVCLTETGLVTVSYYYDLPTVANPTRPILANTPVALLLMYTTEQLLTRYAGTGADYWNFHLYIAVPALEQALLALAWAKAIVGLPVISHEFGIQSQIPGIMTAQAITGQVLGCQYMYAFNANPASPRAQALAVPVTGALTALGVEFQQVVATWGH